MRAINLFPATIYFLMLFFFSTVSYGDYCVYTQKYSGFSPGYIDFGDYYLGDPSESRTVTFSNKSCLVLGQCPPYYSCNGVPAQVTRIIESLIDAPSGNKFSVNGTMPVGVDPDESVEFIVTFNPNNYGADSGYFRFDVSPEPEEGPSYIHVTANLIETPDISDSPIVLGTVGVQTQNRSFTLRNRNPRSGITINSVTASSLVGCTFSAPGPPTSIPANSSLEIEVEVTPIGAGEFSGTVHVNTSYADPSISFSGTAVNVPGAPTGVSATTGIEQATVAFTAPISDGGSPILSYSVTSYPGNIAATGVSSPIQITGLESDNAYTFNVKARNTAGYGPPSDFSNSIIPLPYVPSPEAVPAYNTWGVCLMAGALFLLAVYKKRV